MTTMLRRKMMEGKCDDLLHPRLWPNVLSRKGLRPGRVNAWVGGAESGRRRAGPAGPARSAATRLAGARRSRPPTPTHAAGQRSPDRSRAARCACSAFHIDGGRESPKLGAACEKNVSREREPDSQEQAGWNPDVERPCNEAVAGPFSTLGGRADLNQRFPPPPIYSGLPTRTRSRFRALLAEVKGPGFCVPRLSRRRRSQGSRTGGRS